MPWAEGMTVNIGPESAGSLSAIVCVGLRFAFNIRVMRAPETRWFGKTAHNTPKEIIVPKAAIRSWPGHQQ